jgi:hypothetical protein
VAVDGHIGEVIQVLAIGVIGVVLKNAQPPGGFQLEGRRGQGPDGVVLREVLEESTGEGDGRAVEKVEAERSANVSLLALGGIAGKLSPQVCATLGVSADFSGRGRWRWRVRWQAIKQKTAPLRKEGGL